MKERNLKKITLYSQISQILIFHPIIHPIIILRKERNKGKNQVFDKLNNIQISQIEKDNFIEKQSMIIEELGVPRKKCCNCTFQSTFKTNRCCCHQN